jgi:uncharacterized membrane protein SpoIIM required for sporulation
MRPEELHRSHKQEWNALASLLERATESLQTLTPEEIDRLGRLYRSATSDLALAQREFPTHPLTARLNRLVARAHALVYRSEPLVRQQLGRFFTEVFPGTFREALPFIVVAALLFFLPALAAGAATATLPESAQWLLPLQMQQLIPTIEDQELWTDIPIAERPFASSFIMRNNIQVSILAFGGGIFAGLLTVWTLVFNGLMLGGLMGLTIHHGVGFELGTFVIGHGVVELSVICIAGGSGLMMGWALLHPGLRRRRDALAEAARKSVRLLMGCIPLLLIAGLIEGFLSPAVGVPWPIKWATGIVSGLLLYAYLLLVGREGPRQRRIFPFSSR